MRPNTSRRALLALSALGIVALAGAGYAWLRKPPRPKPLPSAGTPAAQLDAVLQQLEARTVEQPQDPEGWARLARARAALGRRPEALQAFQRALALRPDDADLLADAADVLAVQQGRKLGGEPQRLLERALQANPRHPKALALWGQAALERNDRAAAAQAWQKAIDALPPGDAFAQQLQARIAQLQASP